MRKKPVKKTVKKKSAMKKKHIKRKMATKKNAVKKAKRAESKKRGYHKHSTGCCPVFDAEPWDKKTLHWKAKLFVKDRVFSFFRIPINFGAVINKNIKMIDDAGARDPKMIVLSDENSLFGSDVYLSVKKIVPNRTMARKSGTFLSMVFEGPYSNMAKWIETMKMYVEIKEKNLKKMYFYYPYCPKCAKAYEKNYVVILAKV